MDSDQKVKSLLREAILFAVFFFVLLLSTVSHYGINWDTINHLPRGQSYLHYFLTGKKDFTDLPKFEKYWQKDDDLFFNPDVTRSEVPVTSLYENAGVDFNYFVNNDGGHPPLGGIFASITNTVFFQKLKIINDIDAYRISGILFSALLVGLIYFWTSREFGRTAGVVSVVVLGTYPLYWAESHFNNEKDIPLAFFWSLTLFLFYKVLLTRKFKWMFLSGLAAGCALAIKFNAVFLPFVCIVPFVFSLLESKKINIPFLVKLLIVPTIAIVIFIAVWPYLWADPLSRIQNVIGYYKEIGTTKSFDPRYITFFGFNSYPLIWIILTTPIISLILSILGFIGAIYSFLKTKKTIYLLILSWVIVSVGRVSVPGSNIYGGVRQIMEYIPALSMLAGLGFVLLLKQIKSLRIKQSFIILTILLYSALVYKLYTIHPAENAFFNVLTNGLSGASEKDIPAWGNTFGGIYRIGVNWLNEHAETGAHVSYARELIPNIPSIWLRRDLSLYNQYRSGTLMEGEYVIALTYQGTSEVSYWDRYLTLFLKPIYEYKVDGVPVLKIWKNSPEYVDPQYRQSYKVDDIMLSSTEHSVIFDFGKERSLAKLEFNYTTENCTNTLSYAYPQISTDGNEWKRLPGTMPKEDWSVPRYGEFPKNNSVMIPFVANKARYIQVIIEPQNSCLYNVQRFSGEEYRD